MIKETFYFSHDYNASQDPKLTKLKMKMGHTGKGIYWEIIEMLYQQNGYLETDYEVLAYQIQAPLEQCLSIVEDFGLFEIKDGKFSSRRVLENLKEREEKRKIKVEAGKKGGLKSAEIKHETSNAQAELKQNSSTAQANSTKVKESKVKESKGEETPPEILENSGGQENPEPDDYPKFLANLSDKLEDFKLKPAHEEQLVKDFTRLYREFQEFRSYRVKACIRWLELEKPDWKFKNPYFKIKDFVLQDKGETGEERQIREQMAYWDSLTPEQQQAEQDETNRKLTASYKGMFDFSDIFTNLKTPANV